MFQRAKCVAWLKNERIRRGISRKALARKVWPNSADFATTAQIKRYEDIQFNGEGQPTRVTLPAPETLKKISTALGIPWPAAFANAGYYHEILRILVSLVDLGRLWLREDQAVTEESAAASFRSVGVTRIGATRVWEALEEPRCAARYVKGVITEDHSELEIDDSVTAGLDEETAEKTRQYCESLKRNGRSWAYVAPKPIALAINIVASGFPRRGDVWKRGADMYAARLLEVSTPLIELAQIHSRPKLSGHIFRADKVLQDRELPLDSRRLIAAEHLIAWADGICQGYTHYARLASMDLFGEAGSTSLTLTPEAWLPQRRRATLPDPEIFADTYL